MRRKRSTGTLLVAVLASSLLAVAACSSPNRVMEAELITEEAVSQMEQVINKPVELSKFSSQELDVNPRPYSPSFEFTSEECNLLVDLAFVGGTSLAGTDAFRSAMHPKFRSVTRSEGLGFFVSNRDLDLLTDEGIEEWNRDYEAGIVGESASVNMGWLLFPTIEDAVSFVTETRASVEPCGNLRQQDVLEPFLLTREDILIGVQDFEDMNGFVMERNSVVSLSSDAGVSEETNYSASFVLQISNVVAVVNYGLSDAAIDTLDVDYELTWRGASNLLEQSLAFLDTP